MTAARVDLPTTHRSSERDESLRSVLSKSAAVFTVSLPLAVVGCAGGYLLGVPLNQLAAAVTVPLAVAFIVVRVMIICIPTVERPQGGHVVSPVFMGLATLIFVSLVATVSFSLSAPIYYGLRLADLVPLAIKLAAISLASTFVLAVLAILHALHRVIHKELANLMEVGLWKVFLLPRRLVRRLLAPLPSLTGSGPRAA